ncbi:YncE family protein [Mycolicibacterium sp. 3033]|nr:YncE family protein [Mycolicibacterium aurantiacum]
MTGPRSQRVFTRRQAHGTHANNNLTAAASAAAGQSTTDPNYGHYETTQLGGAPTNVAISGNGGRAFVVVGGLVKIVEIGASAPSVSADVVVGSNPNTVAASVDGARAYVTNSGSSTVSIIESKPFGGAPRVTSVAVGDNPTGIALNSDGTRAFVANSGSDTVSIIDYGPSRPLSLPAPKVTTVAVGPDPTSVAVNAAGTVAYVTNSAGDTVSIIRYNRTGTASVVNVQVSARPSSVKTSDSGTKAIVYSSGGIVTIIDANSSTPSATQVPGTHYSYADYPGFIAISADGTAAFVTEHDSGRVTIVDVANPSASPRYSEFSDYPHSIVALRTGTLAFTVAHDAMYVVDANTGQATPVLIPADNDSSQYQRVAINANGSRVIAVDNSGNLTAFYYSSGNGTTSDPISESIHLWLNSLGTTFADLDYLTKNHALGRIGDSLSIAVILDNLGHGNFGEALYNGVQFVAGTLEWVGRIPIAGIPAGLVGIFLDTTSYAIHDFLKSPPTDWATLGGYVATHPAGAAAGALNGIIGLGANTLSHFVPEGVVKAVAEPIMERNNKIADAVDKGIHGVVNGVNNIAHGRWPWDNG